YHTATAYAVDNVGNRTPDFEVAGYVDNTAPEVSIQPEEDFVVVEGSNYTNRQNQFRVTASDRYAGVREVLVSLDGSEYVTYTGPFKVQLAGRHILRATAVDNLGNRAEPVSVEFFVDVVPPDTSMGVSVD
ncbi:MAG: OmpL47-type beta-barrel domain-containing protein, partial [Spirochaetota bacterium]